MTWMPWLVLALCLLAIGAAVLSAQGAQCWARATQMLSRQLDADCTGRARQPPAPTRYDPRELEGLPAPVQRYFRAVLSPGQAIVAAATVDLAGTINLSATGQQWKAFRSRQRVATACPGFVWDARVALFPAVTVRVVDCYFAGKGFLRAALLGLFTVADLRGGGEIARGEYMRYFAEAAWYPTALLPSQGVRWEAVDDLSARATVVDGDLCVTLLFRFAAAGTIVSAHADARGAQVGKQMVMLPWEGSWSDYQPRNGMLVPLGGEAAWLRPQGRTVYFKGAVTSLCHEFAA